MRICLTSKGSTLGHGDVVHYFCKNCGAEMYAELRSSHSKEQRKRVSLYLKMQTCPECNEKLDHSAGYYYFTYFSEDANFKSNESWFKDKDVAKYETYNVDDAFKHLKEARLSYEQQIAENQVEELCKKATPLNVLCSTNDSINEIKTNTSKLKDYLQNLINIETNIHSLSKRLEALYIQRVLINRQGESKKISYARRMDKPLEEAQKKYQTLLDEYSKLKSTKPEKVSIKRPVQPTAPVLEKPNLFNKKKVEETNRFLMAQYESEVAKYKQDIELYEQEKSRLERAIASEHESILAEALKKVDEAKAELEKTQQKAESSDGVPEHVMAPITLSLSLIEKEIIDAEELLQKLIECRSELYAYNIVFSKYHNLVAVATFYEYLMAGRCEILEGATGAYNLYETELRANLVIGQLTQVIESLEQIKGNQYMIYSEIKNINQNIETLNTTMNSALQTLRKISYDTAKMEGHLDVISHNTELIAKNSTIMTYNSEVTAYYSKANAQLTNALGYMMAFK